MLPLSKEEKAALEASESPTSTWDDSARLFRGCLYGDFGSGKTSLAMKIVQALDAFPALIITTDSAWTVLQKHPEYEGLIDRRPYEGYTQMRVIAKAHYEGLEPYAKYKSIVWDTVSTGVTNTIDRLVIGKKYSDQRDPDVASWTHYNLASSKLREVIEVLNQSNLHVIYNAHVRDPSEDDRKKKRFAIRPDMPWSCFSVVAREVGMIGWLYKEKSGSERLIQLEGTLTETAKSQIPGIEEKTYKQNDIPQLIQNWRKGNN